MEPVAEWLSVITSVEFLSIVCEFLDPISAVELSRTCTRMYCALPRNSAMSVQVWKTYLCDPRYMTNKLVAESARTLVSSDQVSRANYKLILTVLMQKNGFMKINRLKSLCASGRLASPLLPHNGAWKCLTRLDQFALKRASAEAPDEKARPDSTAHTGGSTSSKFVSRIAGRKGKREMVKQHLRPLLAQGVEGLKPVIEILVSELNFAGLVEIIELSENTIGTSTMESLLTTELPKCRNSIEENFLHALVRDKSVVLKEKLELFRNFFSYQAPRSLLNQVNLNHETPLLVLFQIGKQAQTSDKPVWQQIANFFINSGADVYLCDKKGLFYEPLILEGTEPPFYV